MKIAYYWKALIAFLGALGTFLATIVADTAITGALPSNWVIAIGGLATLLTGFGVYRKKNTPLPSVSEKAVTSIQDVRTELDGLSQAAVDAMNRVQEMAGGLAGGVVDRAIKKYLD